MGMGRSDNRLDVKDRECGQASILAVLPIEAWKQSGQTKQAYCSEPSLSRASFQRGCGFLLKEIPAQLSFIPVWMPTLAAPCHAVELTLTLRTGAFCTLKALRFLLGFRG